MLGQILAINIVARRWLGVATVSFIVPPYVRFRAIWGRHRVSGELIPVTRPANKPIGPLFPRWTVLEERGLGGAPSLPPV